MALKSFIKKIFSFGSKQVEEVAVEATQDDSVIREAEARAAEEKAKAEAEEEARKAAEEKAKAEVEAAERAEAERRAAEEAAAEAEAERKAVEDAERAKAEAELAARKKEKAEAKAKTEAEAAAEEARLAREREQERVRDALRQREEERKRAREAEEKAAAERKAAEEEAKAEAKRKAEAEKAAKAEAARLEAEGKKRAEAEQKAEADAKAAAEAEARERAEAEKRRLAEEQATAEAEAMRKAEAQRKADEEAAANTEAERRAAEARQAAEAEARAAAEAEARATEEAAAKEKAEAEKRAADEAAREEAERAAAEEAAAEARAREQAEAEAARKAAEEAEAAERLASLKAEEESAAARPAGKVTVAKTVAEAKAPEPVPAPPLQKKGWLQRLREGLSRSSRELTSSVTGLFTKRKLDEDTLQDLEDILIRADLGLETAIRITDALSQGRYGKNIGDDEVRTVMAAEIEKVLTPVAQPLELDLSHKPHVILVVGVNGTGKTTTIGKLAAKLRDGGLDVMLAAGDTFRAAAIEQLHIWGERVGAPVVSSKLGSDAAGLAFDAFKQAKEAGSDVLIIDTAGRLQNRTELMDELAKIVRVLGKLDPEAPHTVLQTLDATTGQNALSQVEIFRNVAGVNGLVMTKLDGTARGGIMVAIAARHKLPVYFVGVGEQVDDLEPFEAKDFAKAIVGEPLQEPA